MWGGFEPTYCVLHERRVTAYTLPHGPLDTQDVHSRLASLDRETHSIYLGDHCPVRLDIAGVKVIIYSLLTQTALMATTLRLYRAFQQLLPYFL